MADKKISQLTALSAANLAPSTDVLAIVDTSATETKKIVAQDLINGVLNVASAVGIGTASPAYKLDVNGNAQVGNATAATNRFLYINGVANKAGAVAFQESGVNRWLIGNGAASENGNFEIYDATNGNNFILTRTGNLGLGVTPSAWSTAGKNMQFGNGPASIGTQNSGDANFMHNAYESPAGTFKYASSGIGSLRYQLDINNNAHKWYYAASGTAGNAISFTQAMTLDASGNLGVGTTSPSSTLELARTSADVGLFITRTSTGAASYRQFIDGDGDIRLNMVSSKNMRFFTADTERARITSGGDLLVGTTGTLVSSVSRFRVSASSAPAVDAKTTAAADAVIDAWNSAAAGDNTFERFWTEGTATQRGSIDYNRAGGLVRYNTTSDYRAKDVYGLLNDSGETIDALKVYRGKMHGATMERPMLIAHEAQEIAPYAVTGEKDAVNEDGTPKFQQMDTSSLVPLLIAEIQSLRSRVAALEAK